MKEDIEKLMIVKTSKGYYLAVQGIERLVRIAPMTVKCLEMLGIQMIRCELPSEYYLG